MVFGITTNTPRHTDMISVFILPPIFKYTILATQCQVLQGCICVLSTTYIVLGINTTTTRAYATPTFTIIETLISIRATGIKYT